MVEALKRGISLSMLALVVVSIISCAFSCFCIDHLRIDHPCTGGSPWPPRPSASRRRLEDPGDQDRLLVHNDHGTRHVLVAAPAENVAGECKSSRLVRGESNSGDSAGFDVRPNSEIRQVESVLRVH